MNKKLLLKHLRELKGFYKKGKDQAVKDRKNNLFGKFDKIMAEIQQLIEEIEEEL